MDPVTHMLTGACMGRSGLNRKTGLATLTMVLAAEAADCDVVWAIKGPVAALQHHRGITHSFVGAPFVAAATLLFVYLLHRFWLRRYTPRSTDPPVRWGYLYALALIAALSHILLDYTTAYGIRMFEPFNYRWYSWDIVYIVEPLILVALILGLTVPALFGLINQEIGARSKGPRGRGGAVFALVCLVIIWGYRDIQHRRALSAMNSVSYNGAQAQRMGAYPYMINPYHWHGVVETRDFFQTVPVNSVAPEVDARSEARTFYKPEETDVTRSAKASYLGQAYLDWAAFPYLITQKLEGDFKGYLVDFTDLRYAYPETQGRGPLGGYIILNPNLQVEEEGMNSRKKASIVELEHPNQN